jgi:hypothetical protein
LTLINSTISGNTAQRNGGALIAQVGYVNIVNSTLAGNTAGGAGGIEVVGTPVTLKNTIVANNAVTNCRDFLGGNVMSAGHNLQSDGSCSLTQPTDLSNRNPLSRALVPAVARTSRCSTAPRGRTSPVRSAVSSPTTPRSRAACSWAGHREPFDADGPGGVASRPSGGGS